MEKYSYSGRSEKGRYRSVNLPNDAQKIINQGEAIIRGMEAVKAADLANRTAYIQSVKETYALENRWRDKNKSLEDRQREIYQSADLKRYQIDEANAIQQGKNDARVINSLTQFSKTLSGLAFDAAQEQANDQYLDTYWKTMMGGAPLDQQLGHTAAEHDLKIEGEKIEQRADLAQSLGADPAQSSEHTVG